MNTEQSSLTDKQKATNYETLKHIELVMQLMGAVQNELLRRMFTHDRSKLESPEMEMFAQFTDRLADLTYGSEEYKQCLEEMKKSALLSHYEHNRHHTEHFPNGIEDMNLIDIIEMVCDWVAACKRHHDGSILKSLEINTTRFNLSPQLVKILENTIPLLYPIYNRRSQKYLNNYWHCYSCGAGGLEGNFCQMCGDKKWE